MKDFSHLPALVAAHNESFEEFFAHLCTQIPALKGRGAIEIHPGGFKKALKTAYVAGDFDAMARLLASDSTPSSDVETPPST